MNLRQREFRDYLRSTAVYRKYPFLDRMALWEERLLVNQSELEKFASMNGIDEAPIQDLSELHPPPQGGTARSLLHPRPSRPVSDICEASATDLAAAVRSGKISPVDVAEACLARAEQQRHLNAFITIDAALIRAAAKALASRLAKGEMLGALAGVPISVKDIMLVAGYPFTAGTKAVSGEIAERDAACVANLRAADALIFGTGNTHEIGYGATGINPYFGRMGNPASPAHILGGSSGGSVAAVAARIVPGAVGTDTGGSVRIPASCGGVVGMKPTHGAISRDGVMYVAWSLDDVAPITRTVEDAALLFEVMAGRQVGSSLYGEGGDRERFAILQPSNYFFDDVDESIALRISEVIAQLVRTGCSVVERAIDEIELASAAHLVTVLPEAAEGHWSLLFDRPDNLGADVRVRLEVGQFFSAVDYIKAQRLRARLRASMLRALDGLDVLITPSMVHSAPLVESAKNSSKESAQFSREQGRLTVPFNVTGLPSITIPCGVDRNHCPIGIQIAGRPGEDHRVLQAARRCETIIATVM